jgi:protein O-mannosyl-transferase
MSSRKKTSGPVEQRDKGRMAGQNSGIDRSPYPAWLLAAVGFGALIVGLLLYSPALDGPFLFDDLGLPFYAPSFAQQPLSAWIAGVRPLLMLSYWVDFQVSAREPWTYHATNVLLHAVISLLVFVLFFRILRLQSVEARRALLCAGIGAAIFLVHPLQTEAVAYIAGRSELVCGFFVMAALVLFCKPGLDVMPWRSALAILVLYGCAVLSKEQAVVLPAVFLIVDLFIRRRSLREALDKGSRLYYPIVILGGFAVAGVIGLLMRSATAGFNVAGVQWYEYLFTQFRVWLMYLKLAVLPFGQNADYDIAISRSFTDQGAALALVALLVAFAAAWHFRKRYPLLLGGLLMFAVFLAPTSSVIPVKDLAAERRMYLPLAALLIVFLQVLSRMKLTAGVTAGLSAIVFIFSALTHERSKVWSSDIAFWSSTVAQSPKRERGYTHLTYAYIRAHRCSEAVATAERVPEGMRDSPEFLGMLGHAYACDHRMKEAVQAFERAVEVGPGAGRYLALASIYRQVGRVWDAESAEQQALRIPPQTPYDYHMLDTYRKTLENSRSRTSPTGFNRPGG